MRISPLFALGLLSLLLVPSQAAAAEPYGVWRHPDNGSLVRMYECGSGLCAKIIEVRESGRKDVHNPDPAKRSRPVEGIVIMNGAQKTGEDTWEGQLYNTQNGKTYSGVITVQGPKTLELEGCVLGGLLCQGVTWSRVR
jgi:uncharacterized protein (DUF2147 family)